MPAGATAAVGIGGSIAKGVLGSDTASKNAALAQQAAQNGNSLLSGAYNTAQTNLSPYINNGGQASNGLTSLLNGNSNAFNAFRNSTNYQFLLNQGLNGVASADAPALNSGSTVKGLSDYAQGMAGNSLAGYISDLQNQASLGATTGTNLGQLGLTSASDQSNNLLSAAGAGISANNAGLASLASMINGIGQSASSFLNPAKTGS